MNKMLTEMKVTSVPVNEIVAATLRFDAKLFGIDARQARDIIQNSNLKKISLTNEKFVQTATYPLRFRRNYVSNKVGLPFILPSQITEVMPNPYKWITSDSRKMTNELSISKGDLLLTRSGTVGKCAVAGEALEGCLLSDDLIRIKVQDGYLGYLFTFLSSKIGQTLLATSTYGAMSMSIPASPGGSAAPIWVSTPCSVAPSTISMPSRSRRATGASVRRRILFSSVSKPRLSM